MKKLVIFGNGEFASIANYYFSDRDVEFFCADDELCKENSFEKKPLIPLIMVFLFVFTIPFKCKLWKAQQNMT